MGRWNVAWRSQALLAAAALAAGCVPDREPRTAPVIAFERGLVVSNSPTWTENLRPRMVDGELEIPYSIIAHNDGPGSYALLVEQWTFEFRGARARSACSVRGGQPGERPIVWANTRSRVDCIFRYSAADVQRIGGAAGVGQLRMWLKLVDAADASRCWPGMMQGSSSCTEDPGLRELALRYELVAEDF